MFALVGIGLLLLALLPWVSAVQRGHRALAFEEERRSYIGTTLSSLLLLGLAAVLILLSGVWASLVDLVIGVIDRLLPGAYRGRPHAQPAATLLPIRVVVFG